MLYNGKYAVKDSDIVDGVIKWKATGSGAFIIGSYNGADYFIKRYTMGPRKPAPGDTSPQAYQAMWLDNKQAEIRKRFAGLSVAKDHIVVEEENFWDDQKMFVTVTQMVPNENKGFDYTTLDKDDFVKLCTDMAAVVKKAHDVGVTHNDLKEKNILIQKNGSDLVPYLIDFDSSYPSDYSTMVRPDGTPMYGEMVSHSPGYQSPEIAIYNYESERVLDAGEFMTDHKDYFLSLAANITNKTDIFSLGLIFHKLWTGNFPAVIGDTCPVGEAIYCDVETRLDPKFDVALGPVNDCKFSSLLSWMLAKDPTKRPTGQQVIDALNDRMDVEDEFEIAGSTTKFDLEPHDIHKAALQIFDKDVLKKKDVKAFVKITEGGAFKYLARMKDGTEKKMTIDEVVANGFGKTNDATLCTLWEEDANKIEFLPIADITSQGVLSIEPRSSGFKKFYFIALRAGGGYTTSGQGLVMRGFAKEKTVATETVDFDTPWPEHGTAYNEEALRARDVIKAERVEIDGDKRYKLTTKADGVERESVVKAPYMRIMRFFK